MPATRRIEQMPRVTPVSDKSEVAPEHQHVVDGVLEVFGAIRGPHSILLHTPELDEHALALGNFFRYSSAVKSPEKELAIITAAREKDCLYVWAAQVAAGRRGGLREEAIAAVRDRRDTAGLESDEAAIIDYVRQLLRANRVDQPAFDALKDRYGVEWLIEMTTVVGYYGMLAGVVNSFELPPPEGGDVLPV
jgi:4-carboxymuconolactone decarboxylase